jgi:hypothetical protein
VGKKCFFMRRGGIMDARFGILQDRGSSRLRGFFRVWRAPADWQPLQELPQSGAAARQEQGLRKCLSRNDYRSEARVRPNSNRDLKVTLQTEVHLFAAAMQPEAVNPVTAAVGGKHSPFGDSTDAFRQHVWVKRACAETPLTVMSSRSVPLDRKGKGKDLCGSSP